MPAELAVGGSAPTFKLDRDGGGTVSLADFKGKKLVLFFYPKADTSGCTSEALAFSALLPTFTKAGCAVLGVSPDPVKAQDKFKAKHNLTVALAADPTHEMLTAYGVWGKKSMYGRSYMGVIRTTLLIDPRGRIAQIWPKVKVPGHADEVLAAAQAM
ncbi:MAG TPA: peroxiredoxin [Xanthobacteraceae bacterium]|jgi:peroxiredoxin Q/BCP|nr:peroxiredoxin [Xanthobacteraceae bacterium]